MPTDPACRFGPVAIDANALDGDGTQREGMAERFLHLVAQGAVDLLVTDGVRAEMLRPEAPHDLRTLLPPPVAARPQALSHDEKLSRIRVRAILRGDAPSGKHEADAAHLSEAAEAGCTVFVTHDRRILRRRDDLRATLPSLRIMTLERVLAAVAAAMAGEEDEDDR